MIHTKVVVVLFLILKLKTNDAKLVKKFIFGGNNSSIENYPHAAYMRYICRWPKPPEKRITMSSYCSASILNQDLLLTAAHCLVNCVNKNTDIIFVFVGNVKKGQGEKHYVSSFKIHSHYSTEDARNDIALVKLVTRLKFSERVKRVVILNAPPPYNERGSMAGWGRTDYEGTMAETLKDLTGLRLWTRQECARKDMQLLQFLPKGKFCAGYSKYMTSRGNGMIGDSGSGLIVRGHILVGIFSSFVSSPEETAYIYTDVGFYYDWIKKNAKHLLCNTQ